VQPLATIASVEKATTILRNVNLSSPS